MLDAVSLWPEADRAVVFRSFSKNDYLLISSDDPPLTPAQREQIRAIAAAYISDPEKRARFLQFVE